MGGREVEKDRPDKLILEQTDSLVLSPTEFSTTFLRIL